MVLPRWFVPLCFAALACTPKLNGICANNSDCQPGELCSAGGLCLLPGAANGNGDAGNPSDAGASDAGTVTGGAIDILSPAAAAIERGTFHVSAQTSSSVTIQDVTFSLKDASSGAALGQLVVGAASLNNWSGELSLNAASFGGGADLVAVMHRAGLADVTSNKVRVTVDQNAPSISPNWNAAQWWVLDAGITVTAAASDDRSGVAAASLILPDGGTVAGTLASGTASFQLPASAVGAPGTVFTVPVSLAATDVAGNSALRPDASTLSVDDQPPAIALVALDPALWRNGPLNLNANVGDGAGSGLGGTSLLLNGAFTPGTPDGGGGFSYHVDLSLLPATEATVALQVLAVDAVGNQADAGFNLSVDNVLPVLNTARIDTAFDGTDGTGQGWFQGPTAAPTGAAIAVSVVVKDTNLVTTGTRRPAAIVSGTSYYGTLNTTTNRWGFSIPRAVGLNASAPVVVSFDAQDLAGNHPASVPSLSLQFDDVPASSFTPVVAADGAWHTRTGTLGVGVSVAKVPRSGFASLLLKVSGQADVTCTTSTNALNWSCLLPATYAAAATEVPLNFQVVASSNARLFPSQGGNRLIDDVVPSISSAAAVTYPNASGPIGWSHNGTSFNLREGYIGLYSFTASDCGAGIQAITSFSVNPTPSTRSTSLTDSGLRVACATGRPNAVVYNVTVKADLSTIAGTLLPGGDNTVHLQASVNDNAVDPVGAFPHTSSAGKDINVTRRLWQTTVVGANTLAMGPVLIAGGGGGVLGFNAGDGTSAWSTTTTAVTSGPSVGGTAGAPLVYYAEAPVDLSGNGQGSFSVLSASTGGHVNSCPSAIPISCAGGTVTVNQQAIAVADDGTAAVLEEDANDNLATTTGTCAKTAYAGYRLSSCASWIPTVQEGNTTTRRLGGLAIGRGGTAFFILSNTPRAANVSGGAVTGSALACNGFPIVTDKAGLDAPVCAGQRVLWNGSFSSDWSATFSAPYLSSGGYLLGNVSGNAQPFTVSNGLSGGLAGASSSIPWAIDAASPPLAYLSNGGSIVAQQLTGTGLGAIAWALPAVPGAVADVVMDKFGVLYVASNGQISAMITHSPGLGTGANGWPIAGRDACRSYNLGYSCPW